MKRILIMCMLFCGACALVERTKNTSPFRVNNGANTSVENGGVAAKDNLQIKVVGELTQNNPGARFDRISIEYFNENGTVVSQVDLPDEAISEITNYLDFRLKMCDLKKSAKQTAQEQFDKDVIINRTTAATRTKLKNIQIQAPLGLRKISDGESLEIISFVAQTAADQCS